MKTLKRILVFLLVGVVLLFAGCGKEEKQEKVGGPLESVKGGWEGAIEVPEQPLPIIITFTKDDGTISIPNQGVNDYPLSNVKMDGQNIFFEMEIEGQKVTFDGEIAGKGISGSFKQQGQTFPFALMKMEAKKGDTVEIEVTGGKLQGLVSMPKGDGPFPVMVIIAGSGPTDKDGNSLAMAGKNNSLKMIADYLAAHDIASVRYDKRGIGENIALGGKEEDLRFEDYIDDAAAWLEWAKRDARFSKAGVIGHSEGSFIGMIAAEKAKAGNFVSLAGPGRPFDEVLMEQLAGALPEELLKEATAIIEELKAGKQVPTVSGELQAVFRPSVQPYLLSMLAYDPTEALKQLDAKVMIVNGERDMQVSVNDAQLLNEAKPGAQLLILEKMNHVLKDAPEDEEGNLATYTNPDLPLAEGLMEEIVMFLQD